MTTSLNCPRCGQVDAVRKVSAVVEGDTATVKYDSPVVWEWQGKIYTGSEEKTAISRTALATQLMPPGHPAQKYYNPIPGWIWFFVGLFTFTIGWWVGLSGVEARSNRKKAEKIAEQKGETAKWYEAMRRWNELYYCTRDGIVFIPGESRSASIQNMIQFLYE